MSDQIDVPFYIVVWLITEMSRSDNRIETKNRYKRVFGSTLSDSILGYVHSEYLDTIQNLKKVNKADFEAHPLASPRKRMEEYEEIAKTAKEGFYNGVTDATGMPVVKIDPRTALEAVKAAANEANTMFANELKLLQILVQGGGASRSITELPNNDHIDPPLITQVPPSDNDKFFE